MNKQEECSITRDLALQFFENSINEKSANFVKKHLETCNDCKEYYSKIENRLSNENNLDDSKDNIVINQFKKIHKHMNILKLVIVLMISAIIIIGISLFIKEHNFSKIVNTAYEKINYMKSLDNYKLTVKTIEKDLTDNNSMEYEQIYYYKDGKYKIESEDSIKFYQDDSYEKICVYNDLKTKEYYQQDFIEFTKGKPINTFSEIINYKKLTSTIYSLSFSIREERYNGIDCYVIRFGNYSSYRDTWIDKNSWITLRVVNEENGKFYREDIYSFEENIVKDEDVDTAILDSEEYKDYSRKDIINNATEEIKLYNELYNKNL